MCTDFLSLVVVPFVLLGRVDFKLSTAGGRFGFLFQLHKRPSDITFCHPTSEQRPPPKGNLVLKKQER